MRRTDISNLERGEREAGDDVLARLAQALEVSVIELAPQAQPDAKGLDYLGRLEELEDAVRGLPEEVRRLAALLELLDDRVEVLELRDQTRNSPATRIRRKT